MEMEYIKFHSLLSALARVETDDSSKSEEILEIEKLAKTIINSDGGSIIEILGALLLHEDRTIEDIDLELLLGYRIFDIITFPELLACFCTFDEFSHIMEDYLLLNLSDPIIFNRILSITLLSGNFEFAKSFCEKYMEFNHFSLDDVSEKYFQISLVLKKSGIILSIDPDLFLTLGGDLSSFRIRSGPYSQDLITYFILERYERAADFFSVVQSYIKKDEHDIKVIAYLLRSPEIGLQIFEDLLGDPRFRYPIIFYNDICGSNIQEIVKFSGTGFYKPEKQALYNRFIQLCAHEINIPNSAGVPILAYACYHAPPY